MKKTSLLNNVLTLQNTGVSVLQSYFQTAIFKVHNLQFTFNEIITLNITD